MASFLLLTYFRTESLLLTVIITLLSSIPSSAVHISGFRVESPQPDNFSTDSTGLVYIVGGRYKTLRLFTDTALSRTAEISFTIVSAERDFDCTDLRTASVFPVQPSVGGAVSGTHSATVRILLPSNPAVYMFCARTEPNAVWRHQGNSTWLQLAVYMPIIVPAVAPSILPFWAHIFLIIVVVAVAATCTALSVTVLSLTRVELKLLRGSGSSDERCFAKGVSPLRKRGNRILSAVVFLGVVCCATVAILIEDMIQLTGASVALSSSLILVFVVIIPLIVCAHMKLAFITSTLCMGNLAVVLSFPFSYPMGRLLDWMLSDDLPAMCDRSHIQSFQRANQASMAVKEVEEDLADAAGGTGTTSILGLSDKSVKDLMTTIEDVFMVEYSMVLDEKCLEHIAASGYTRIPVYEKERTNIVALLHICDLAYVSATDGTSLKTLCKFYNRPVNFVFEDTKLEVLLSEFKKGQSRMAFVQRVNDEGPGDPFYETLGMITFEDVIADIFQSGVTAEPPDIVVDSGDEVKNLNLNRINKNNFARLPRAKKELSDQMTTAVCQFLATSLMQFSRLVMSEKVLRRLLKQDVVVVSITLSDPCCNRTLYERGKPSNHFTLIVEGHVQIQIGSEDFMFDGGPFMYFGAQALTGEMVSSGCLPAQHSTVDGVGDGSHSHIYIPDYTVEAVTDLLVIRVSTDQYAGALHAASLDHHLRAIDSRGRDSDVSHGAAGEFPPMSSGAPSPVVEYASSDQLLDGSSENGVTAASNDLVSGGTKSSCDV